MEKRKDWKYNKFGVKDGCDCYRNINGVLFVSRTGVRIDEIMLPFKIDMRKAGFKIRIVDGEIMIPQAIVKNKKYLELEKKYLDNT